MFIRCGPQHIKIGDGDSVPDPGQEPHQGVHQHSLPPAQHIPQLVLSREDLWYETVRHFRGRFWTSVHVRQGSHYVRGSNLTVAHTTVSAEKLAHAKCFEEPMHVSNICHEHGGIWQRKGSTLESLLGKR